MKLLVLLFTFVSASYAGTAQFQTDVVDLINESIYFGDIESYSSLEFVGTNVDGHETFKLAYTYPVFGDGSFNHGGTDIDEIIGSENTCEYIYFDQAQNDFFFTGFECSVSVSKALGAKSEFSHSEAEISEVLQTDSSFSFVIDYDVPTHVETIVDEINGNLEVYKIEYINEQHNAVCEYITFDPEIDYLVFTGIACGKSADDVIEENLREID